MRASFVSPSVQASSAVRTDAVAHAVAVALLKIVIWVLASIFACRIAPVNSAALTGVAVFAVSAAMGQSAPVVSARVYANPVAQVSSVAVMVVAGFVGLVRPRQPARPVLA